MLCIYRHSIQSTDTQYLLPSFNLLPTKKPFSPQPNCDTEPFPFAVFETGINPSVKMFPRSLFFGLLVCILGVPSVSASVFLPYDAKTTSYGRSSITKRYQKNDFGSRQINRMRRASSTNAAAMAIPGYGVAEQVFVGGFMNFLSIYNLVITARILLSWFPQAQGVAILQPVFMITDPYLNLFRGIVPPVFGLDLSPLLAFFLLNVLSNATAALGADMTPDMKKKFRSYSPFEKSRKPSFGF